MYGRVCELLVLHAPPPQFDKGDNVVIKWWHDVPTLVARHRMRERPLVVMVDANGRRMGSVQSDAVGSNAPQEEDGPGHHLHTFAWQNEHFQVLGCPSMMRNQQLSHAMCLHVKEHTAKGAGLCSSARRSTHKRPPSGGCEGSQKREGFAATHGLSHVLTTSMETWIQTKVLVFCL